MDIKNIYTNIGNLKHCASYKCNIFVKFKAHEENTITSDVDNQTIEHYDTIGVKTRSTNLLTLPQAIRQMENFIKYIPKGGKILDAGCGTGRDSKYFSDLGYDVCAFDASSAMCKLASEYTGLDVINTTFEKFKSNELFDGIYARNSLLHVPRERFDSCIENLAKHLKKGGIFWATLKSGCEQGRDKAGRLYNYFSYDELLEIIRKQKNLEIIEMKEYKDEITEGNDKIIEIIAKAV